jgi:hypothetical protein
MNIKVEPTLHRVLISKDEFMRAMEFIEAARRHDESTIEYEALVHSAIIFYARPFTNNEGPRSGAPKEAQQLTGVDVESVLGEDFAFHKRIVGLRMKVVAHSEAAFNPAEYIPVTTTGNSNARGVVFGRQTWHVLFENLDLDVFMRIAQEMHRVSMLYVFKMTSAAGRLQTPVLPLEPKR